MSGTERFAFGENWLRFLDTVDESRIAAAESSLATWIGRKRLADRSFLDIGCGSGLFSLAARRLGARVHSFDYDPASVACANELKHRFRPNDSDWTVERGSVLDADYMRALGHFDVVYSWGVLHHTGDLWRALEHAAWPVAEHGVLMIAVYNDQGLASRGWLAIKRTYVRVPALAKGLMLLGVGAYFEIRAAVGRLLRGQNPLPLHYLGENRYRGMSAWHDLKDWVGGYPFEVAKPEQIFDFYDRRGFRLERLVTCGGGLGCNEFVFRREVRSDAAPA